jgi:hypothetical protein
MTGKYVALMETNGKECESWYYFIKLEGNEEALKHLQDQLEQIDWYILDDLSTFDLDLDNPVDASTAKQMTKVDLNAYSFHRKFDGKLDKINFSFSKKDRKNNERMMCKVFDVLGYGQLEDYIDDEDIDPEDLVSCSDSDSNNSDSSNSSDESESSSSEEERKHVSKKGLPPGISSGNKNQIPIPRWAKAKKRH